jgi:hypothetical protein
VSDVVKNIQGDLSKRQQSAEEKNSTTATKNHQIETEKNEMTMLTFGHSHDEAEFFIKVTIIFFTVRCLGNYTSFTFIKAISSVFGASFGGGLACGNAQDDDRLWNFKFRVQKTR